MSKRYFIYDWQNKSIAFDRALKNAGFEKVDNILIADIVLTDLDLPSRMDQLLKRVQAGLTHTFCYPHAAIPPLFWDGILSPWEYLSGTFVTAETHKTVLDIYGYPNKIYVVGWPYTPFLPFKPVRKPTNILFAPIHPNQSTYLPAEDKTTNAKTFNVLLDYCQKSGCKLTVRHIESLNNNGLHYDIFPTYIRGDKKVTTYEDLLGYDMVVGRHTILYLAVALGIPALGMDEGNTPKSGKDENSLKYVQTWEYYKNYVKFPLDILTGDVYEQIFQAGQNEVIINLWKETMLGKPFDPQAFVSIINSYL